MDHLTTFTRDGTAYETTVSNGVVRTLYTVSGEPIDMGHCSIDLLNMALLASVLDPLGFALARTGGNCTAFEAIEQGNGNSWLITNGEASAPTSLNSACVVSVWDEQGNEIDETPFNSVTQALTYLETKAGFYLEPKED